MSRTVTGRLGDTKGLVSGGLSQCCSSGYATCVMSHQQLEGQRAPMSLAYIVNKQRADCFH